MDVTVDGDAGLVPVIVGTSGGVSSVTYEKPVYGQPDVWPDESVATARRSCVESGRSESWRPAPLKSSDGPWPTCSLQEPSKTVTVVPGGADPTTVGVTLIDGEGGSAP